MISTAYISGSLLLLLTGWLLYVRQRQKFLNKIAKNEAAERKNTPDYYIQKAEVGDIEIIRGLALEIWPRTYSELFSPQQVIYMLNQMFSEASLLKQMQESHQFSIIYSNNSPIGFASYSEIRPYIFKLHKIYILPAYQGLGAGKHIMEHVIESIKMQKALSLLLNVNQNSQAKAFYEHLGFKITKTERTEVGRGYYLNEYVMELVFASPEEKSEKTKAILTKISG